MLLKTMRDLAKLILSKGEKLQGKSKKNLADLIKKTESFIHAPVSLKEAERVFKFNKDKEVSDVVADTLATYSVWSKKDYDIITYWYCVALLSASEEKKSVKTLSVIADNMIKKKFADLNLLKRNFSFFDEEYKHLDALKKKVQKYFDSIKSKIESAAWANEIGLVVPARGWKATFQISTDGTYKFPMQLSRKEHDTRLTLEFRVFSNASGKGESWEIEVKNYASTVFGRWTNPKETFYRTARGPAHLKSAPSLINFKSTLEDLEKTLKVKFVRTVSWSYFSKGIKNSGAIEEWVKTL